MKPIAVAVIFVTSLVAHDQAAGVETPQVAQERARPAAKTDRQRVAADATDRQPSPTALLKRFDANGDGQLDAQERQRLQAAIAAFRQRGQRPEITDNQDRARQRRARVDLSPLLTRFDTNSNGRLDPAERQLAVAEAQRQKSG